MADRKIRITHVVLQLHTGGMEKLLVELARHADRRRFDLRFVCIGERGAVADEIEGCGWPLACLGYAPGLRPTIAYRLAREFSAGQADVVHTHNNVPLIYGGPAALLAGVRGLIQTRHGQTSGTTRRHRAAFRLASMLADRVVCVSEDSLRLSATEGVPARRLAVVRNGIDTFRFAYTGPAAGGPVVMVGRLVAAKGADHLLRAAAAVVPTRPEFRLEIAGDGEARAGLEAMAAELGLSGHVQFHGTVRDIPGLLSRASAVVLPSLSEGISLTLLEAMARGLPVIATRVGGNPEVVVDGVTGRLVPPADPAGLATALLELGTVSDHTRALGRAGRARVERLFDVRRMVDEYESLYLRVARQPPSTPHRWAAEPRDDPYQPDMPCYSTDRTR
jgi:glycosyltransferase involved in cell wall biosynthesis